MVVIPDGISDEFYVNEDEERLREKLSRKSALNLRSEKIVLSVGRLVERKGFHWFIENVLPEIAKGRDIIYLVVGDGPLRGRLEDLVNKSKIKKSVILLGKVDDETLRLLYNTADILVMPNIEVEGDMEGFGIVALEAASCRVPVVASALEGIRDAIRDGENGFLVEPYSVQGFVNVIAELLENDKERKEFGKMVREFTLENYSWERVAEEYYTKFEEML